MSSFNWNVHLLLCQLSDLIGSLKCHQYCLGRKSLVKGQSSSTIFSIFILPYFSFSIYIVYPCLALNLPYSRFPWHLCVFFYHGLLLFPSFTDFSFIKPFIIQNISLKLNCVTCTLSIISLNSMNLNGLEHWLDIQKHFQTESAPSLGLVFLIGHFHSNID